MDPNANLAMQRAIAARLLDGRGSTTDRLGDAIALSDLVQALDEWITKKGGFLPDAWNITRDGRHL